MNKKLKRKIDRMFHHIKYKKVVLFKNPNEICSWYIERINPTHVGTLWGKRKKNLGKGCHYIRWGKIFFISIPMIYGLSVASWFDCMTGYVYNVLASIGLFSMIFIGITTVLFYYLPLRLGVDIRCSIS